MRHQLRWFGPAGGGCPPIFFLQTLAVAVTIFAALPGCFGKPQAEPDDVHPRPSQPASLLLSTSFPNVLVEIDYVEPHAPSAIALDALRASLKDQAEKRNVTILDPTTIPAQATPYSTEDLKRIDAATFDHGTPNIFANGSTALVHVLYLNGRPVNDTAEGYHLWEGAMILFPELYDRTSGPVGVSGLGSNRDQIERFVLMHELGHAYGLVNCGIPMVYPRDDSKSPCHSVRGESVMSGWKPRPVLPDPQAWLQDQVLEFKWRFDEYDLEDMRAFRRSISADGQGAG